MTIELDIALDEQQRRELLSFPAELWFTQVKFSNVESPRHPNAALAANNTMKQRLCNDLIDGEARGNRVLDLFSANGAFAFRAALSGAREVVGVEFAEDRVRCARWVADQLNADCPITFRCTDVYRLAQEFEEPFDVTLCLGGLYHVADPAYVLRQIGLVTTRRLIIQTSHVIWSRRNLARFVVRRDDETTRGMTSIRAGHGMWYYSPPCIRELLRHGGFRPIEERFPPLLQRRRFPWYVALCEKV